MIVKPSRCLAVALLATVSSLLLAQGILDFESYPDGSVTNETDEISTEYSGVTFAVVEGTCPRTCSGGPRIAKVGPPLRAFDGPGGILFPACGYFGDPIPPPSIPDMPNAAEHPLTSCSMLTDDDTSFSSPCALQIDYDPPASAASGLLLDIDQTEAWTISRFLGGNPVGAPLTFQAGDADTGNGVATEWGVSGPTFDRLFINYTGSCSLDVGLAFDNFAPRAVCDPGIIFESLRHDDALATPPPGITTYSENGFGFVIDTCHSLFTLGSSHGSFSGSTAMHWAAACDVPHGLYAGAEIRAGDDHAFSVCSVDVTELTAAPDRPYATFQAETSNGTAALTYRLDGNRWRSETVTGFPPDMTKLLFGPSIQVDNICICENPPPSCIEPLAGIVSWYAGDDCAAGDRAGFRNGTFLGPINCPDDAKVGPQSMRFESSDNNSVFYPHTTALEPALGDFSLDLWVKVPTGQGGLNGQSVLVSKDFAYTLRLVDGRPVFEACDQSFCMIPLQSSRTLSLDTWHFLSVVISRSTGVVRLFVDNNVDIQPFPLGNVTAPGASFRIGALSPAQLLFDGLIDELEIFKRALSFSEVAEIRDADSRGKCKYARKLVFYGDAQGGSLAAVLSALPLSVPTQSGEASYEVARNLADAITSHPTLAARGVSAMAIGNELLIAGAPPEAISSTDPGIRIVLEPFALNPADPNGELWEWDSMPAATSYDLVRGNLHDLIDDGSNVRLGNVFCLENNSADTTTAAGSEAENRDAVIPAPGEGFFYLVRHNDGLGAVTYGFAEPSGQERLVDGGDCP